MKNFDFISVAVGAVVGAAITVLGCAVIKSDKKEDKDDKKEERGGDDE